MKKYDIAIVGATGLVGSNVISILEERNFPINDIYFLASHRSTGEMLDFNNKSYFVENLAQFDFTKTQICFFCVGNDIAAEYAPKAVAAGNIVIDKSSYFRYDPHVPLIVPEVNKSVLNNFNKGIIASPNCNTIPIVLALKPLYDAVGISRINLATYQSVSGSGKEAINELASQTALLLNGQPVKAKVYSKQIAFNVLPHIDDFEENGYTREEMKIVWETRKIFSDDSIAINPTTVRVPVFFGHSAAVHIETKDKLTIKQAIKLLSNADGVKLIIGKNSYPTPVNDAAGTDFVYVGRVREDISHSNGLNLWVVTDNIRKGAALNAIQIAETLLKQH